MRSILSLFDRKKKDQPKVNYIEVEKTDSTSTYLRNHLPDLEGDGKGCLLYTSPSPRDDYASRMPSSA